MNGWMWIAVVPVLLGVLMVIGIAKLMASANKDKASELEQQMREELPRPERHAGSDN
ncbi:hypothetical protein [Paenibacillus soyae]|uniref:Uncharacterized protein n=1 Tax=Paenibacillus soyae TaxID=2969249 RepID=A0A9X2MV09_9BACL|nr:hypothetical protein [Paenibacillus soyae]MCR2807384.1 hypothetical protein [Paenibacillus soyae]